MRIVPVSKVSKIEMKNLVPQGKSGGSRKGVLNWLILIVLAAIISYSFSEEHKFKDNVDAPVSVAELRNGEAAVVPSHEWVRVLNEKPVESGNNDFVRGDTCSIDHAGIVHKEGIQRDRVLVRYEVSGRAYGAKCPSGTLFFLDLNEYNSMNSKFHDISEAKEAERLLVKGLLSGK